MIRIYIKQNNKSYGHVFKCRSSVKSDKVAILPWIGFVTTGLITEEEWTKSQQSICEKFSLYISEKKIDGRTKLAKNMRYFTWENVLYNNKKVYSI